jgi:hypothetical protein
MLIAAATLTAAISLQIDLGALIQSNRDRGPRESSGIRTVGYHFEGKPGQKFRYAGDEYTIPEEGWVELLADRRNATYRINNQNIALQNLSMNQFGFGVVSLPAPPTMLAAKENQ